MDFLNEKSRAIARMMKETFGIEPRPVLQDDGNGIQAFGFSISGGAQATLRPGESINLGALAGLPNYDKRARAAFEGHIKELGGDGLTVLRKGDELWLMTPEAARQDLGALKQWAEGLLANAHKVAKAEGTTLARFNDALLVEGGIEDGNDGAICLPPALTTEWLLKQFVDEARIEVNVAFSGMEKPPQELHQALLGFLDKVQFKDKAYDLNNGLQSEVNRLLVLPQHRKDEPHREALYALAERVNDIALEKLQQQGSERDLH